MHCAGRRAGSRGGVEGCSRLLPLRIDSLAPWQKHKRFEIGLGCLDHSVRDACEPPPQTRRQHGAAAMRSGGTPLVLELVQGVRSKAQAGGAEFVSRSGAGHVHWGSVLDFRALHLHALSRITGLGV